MTLATIAHRTKRVGSALLAAVGLFVIGLVITLDLMWRAISGKEEA